MASITIREIDDRLKARLRVQAAHNGHSMEEEAREILRAALSAGRARTGTLVDSIRAASSRSGAWNWRLRPARPYVSTRAWINDRYRYHCAFWGAAPRT